MINPLDLQNAIVGLLRAIPELVAIIGDLADIQAYDDECLSAGSQEQAEKDMMGRAVLVLWAGAECPRAGETRGWKHAFKIALKAESIQSYHNIAKAIIDGIPAVPAGDGFNSFLNSTISPLTDGIQDVLIEPERGDDRIGRLYLSFSITEY